MDTKRHAVPFSSCPLCFEKYEIPKILPCGHTFCEECIQSMIKRSIKECPKCKKTFVRQGSRIAKDFPTNYDLLSAIDERSDQSNRDDANEGQDEEEASDNSQMEITTQCIFHSMPYEFFCNSCSEQTCKNCLLDKHNPSTHKITTKTDYLEVQSKSVQKLAEQLNGLLSIENNFNKQLAEADSTCHLEAKKLEEQIMEDLEMKIKRQREEAEKMIKQISAESQQKRNKLKKIREEQNLLITKTKEQQRSNDAVKRAIGENCVTNPSTLEEIKKKTDEISKQTNNLQQSSKQVETGLHMKFQRKKHQLPYLGYLESNAESDPSIWNMLSALQKTHRRNAAELQDRLSSLTNSTRLILIALLVLFIGVFSRDWDRI